MSVLQDHIDEFIDTLFDDADDPDSLAEMVRDSVDRYSHVVFPVSDWKYAVENGDTKLGYQEWLAHQIEAATS